MEALGWIVSAGSNVREETQLKDEVDRLRITLPKARFLIGRGEWCRFKNKELAELLTQLKDSTYDAEDLLRELADQDLRQEIEDAGRTRAHQVLSSSLNLARSFIHGNKTRVKEAQNKLDKAVVAIEGVLNSMGFESEQFMPETSSVVSAPQVFGRDKERDALMEMLGVPIGRVDKIDQVIEQLGVPLTSRGGGGKQSAAGSKGPPDEAGSNTSNAKRLKTGCGRVGFPQTSCTGDVSVLTVYGIGGVGKTTLAQLICNDPRVEHNFPKKIWVCVTDLFDKKRITKEILESISRRKYNQSCSLNTLQEKLKKELERCPKFLLVLDDIWPNANDAWDEFYAPLRTGPEGSMILVTTRYPVVANLVTTSNCDPVELKGLPADVFWEFFRKCAFGKNHPEAYPILQDIGRSISCRLCGSPLAAKTLGRLLNMELTERHWRTVQESELWELPHRDNEILPALQLSYLCLPQELKRCFAFCSMFPKDYSFKRYEIVNIWVAQGFIEPKGTMRLEDLGNIYLDELISRFLFQDDPKFHYQLRNRFPFPAHPNSHDQWRNRFSFRADPKFDEQTNRYVMHDLIHDMAQSISADECFLMQGWRYQNQRRTATIRHMTVEEVYNESLSTFIQNKKESLGTMREFQYLDKLRSLRFGIRSSIPITWFNQLSNILFLSLQGCSLIKLPESICELSSLRYLDISRSSVQELPEKFWCLYSLQVLDASSSDLRKIHQDVIKLINLRRLALPEQVYQAFLTLSRLGNLSRLESLSHFRVGRNDGKRIIELKSMDQLAGKLSVLSLNNVQSMEEAAEARLFDKQYIKELTLHWEEQNMIRQLRADQNGVIEGLRPHSRIGRLEFHGFCGDRFSPTWFRREDLPSLRSLKLHGCLYLKCLSVPCIASLEELELSEAGIECLTTSDDGIRVGSTGDHGTQNLSSSISWSNDIASSTFTRLTALRLSRCNKLRNLDQFLSPDNLPSVKLISLKNCDNLVSIPVQSFVRLVYLQDLTISGCDKLACPQEMVLPSSLQRLWIEACGELDKSFPACLENVTSLSLLKLIHCHTIRFLPLSSIAGIKCLILYYCPELSSLAVSHAQSSFIHTACGGIQLP
ncbi:hypothetical protein QOZ80_8BG0643550 [Eleusine coracana subsp. coracana]|nr:hypothetical protein QOZ80_8BG0643550 [Eleusine coracana subsp. coracana]